MQPFIIRLFASVATFIIGVAVSSLWPTQPFTAFSNNAAEQEVLSLEQQYLDAHTRRDRAALDRILSDDFTFWHCGRRVTNKAERLALMDDTDFTFISIKTEGTEVKIKGDRAIVTGRARVMGRYNDREFFSPPYQYSRMFEKRQGRWQMVGVHATHVSWED
jgi:ketosteroid isomerase-like protein